MKKKAIGAPGLKPLRFNPTVKLDTTQVSGLSTKRQRPQSVARTTWSYAPQNPKSRTGVRDTAVIGSYPRGKDEKSSEYKRKK